MFIEEGCSVVVEQAVVFRTLIVSLACFWNS